MNEQPLKKFYKLSAGERDEMMKKHNEIWELVKSKGITDIKYIDIGKFLADGLAPLDADDEEFKERFQSLEKEWQEQQSSQSK